jgi:hypothetical protein
MTEATTTLTRADMDEFKEWAASRAAAGEGNNVVALAS